MALPESLTVPHNLALAGSAKVVPAETGFPGGSRYEPKWDGFRASLVSDQGPTLWSRQGTDLSPAVPDLVDAGGALPTGTVLEGELVIWVDGGLSFDALQQPVFRRVIGDRYFAARFGSARASSSRAFSNGDRRR